MWESSLSQASFHSLFEVTLNCRWQRWKAWHSTVQRGKGVGKGRTFSRKKSLACIFFPHWHQGLVILRQKTIKRKPNNIMQMSKFSSFRVYCRKRGKTDILKISKSKFLVLNSSHLSPPSSQSPFSPLPSFPLMPCLSQRVPPTSLPPCSHYRCCLWKANRNKCH